jgi:hypothetical protein
VRVSILVVGVVSLVVLVPFASAQEAPPPSPVEIAVACAPTADATHAPHALRIVGTQDTVPRTVLGKADLLIVNGGTEGGVQLGAQFFVRRPSTTVQAFGIAESSDIVTNGWIRIVAVNDTTAVARVEGLCGPIYVNDYLEPFTPPQVVAASDAPIDPDFDALGHVVTGADGHTITGINELAIVDRGTDNGLRPGVRFAIYRDLTSGLNPLVAAPSGTPLTSIGEGVVVSTTSDRSVVRIVRARDAVRTGDYIAPAK